MTRNKHNRLTVSNSHEEILLLRMKVNTLEILLNPGCKRKLSDLFDLAAAATWPYRYFGSGICCVFKGISDFPRHHFCLSFIYITAAVHAAELIPFIPCADYTE